jgi:hypothetical protein
METEHKTPGDEKGFFKGLTAKTIAAVYGHSWL